jgi:hypothetical protein
VPRPSQYALDESLQRLHDSQDRLRICVQRIRKNRLINRISVLEQYSEGNLSLILHMNSGGHVDIPRRFLVSSEGESTGRDFATLLRFDVANARIQNSWNKKPMLISDVQSVYGPNGVIPSRVGLYIAHHSAEEVGGLIYAVPAKRGFKVVLGGVGGEFSELSQGMRGEFSDGFDPSIIEGTLEIVDGVPHDQGNLSDSIPIHDVMLDNFVSKLRIDLDGGNVTLLQQLNPLFKSSDMMIGPFDFGPSIIEISHAES